MPASKPLILNSFQMAAPSHNWVGLWRHPRNTEAQYHQLRYWTELAKTAERGLLDGIFIADVFGTYDVYGGNAEAALRSGAQAPNADPTLAISAMAHVTEHLGFGVTANLSIEHPYSFARRFSTLDHYTQGRLGWNIVTGYLDSGARGMGRLGSREHDQRYEVAEDFMAATYALWEGSWASDAVKRDPQHGIYADPARVTRIRHDGPYYQVDGAALAEPSPQRTPVLFQAGTSSSGLAFAGRHAELSFINGPTPALAARAAHALRQAAVAAGRDPHALRILLGATVIVAPTRAEALALRDEYQQYIDRAGQLALVSGWTGQDLAGLRDDERVRFGRSNAIRSTADHLRDSAPDGPLVRDLWRFCEAGARAPVLVGSAIDVADAMAMWVEATGIDGFNLVRTVMPESLDAIVDLLVPELQSRGMFKTRYREGSLREKLFDAGSAWLPASHPGAGYRR